MYMKKCAIGEIYFNSKETRSEDVAETLLAYDFLPIQ